MERYGMISGFLFLWDFKSQDGLVEPAYRAKSVNCTTLHGISGHCMGFLYYREA